MNEKIKEKLKFDIAISQIKEEEVAMKSNEKFIMKNIGIAAGIVLCLSGVAFAGTKVIERIWNTPTKFEYSNEITDDVKKENITLEEAEQKALEVLKKIGFNANIIRSEEYKDVSSDEITYRFFTEDEYSVQINGKTGEFFDIWDVSENSQNDKEIISEEEAKERANYFYKLFGCKENEYELTKVYVNNKDGSGVGSGYSFYITYNKKYGEVINPYESINITIYASTDRLAMFRIENYPFDNNEILISKEDAIQIALQEDEKIETNAIEKVDAKLMVVKMNGDAYYRINDTDKYYESMQTVNYPNEERVYYSVDDKIRNAWAVVIMYEDNFDGDEVRSFTEGQYCYYVDATTGEIIGGTNFVIYTE